MAKIGKSGKVQTSIYIPEPLYWAFKGELTKRRISQDNDALIEALRQWVGTPAVDESGGLPTKLAIDGSTEQYGMVEGIQRNPDILTPSKREREWVAKLLAILRSQDGESIGAVQSNLNVFCRGLIEHTPYASFVPSLTRGGKGKKASGAAEAHKPTGTNL